MFENKSCLRNFENMSHDLDHGFDTEKTPHTHRVHSLNKIHNPIHMMLCAGLLSAVRGGPVFPTAATAD